MFSSSRSIKRKRFDDEIVEYSLGLPPAQLSRMGRSRTASQTYVTSTPTTPQPQTSAQSPSFQETPTATVAASTPVTTSPPAAVVPSPPAAVNTPVPVAQLPPPLPPPQPVVAPVVVPTTPATPVVTTPFPVVPGTSNIRLNMQCETVVYYFMSFLDQLTPNPVAIEKRRAAKAHSTAKKSKKARNNQQISTKDLGRWKPIDDLALIIGIQQTNDIRTVHRGVKFSCKFTIQELQNRWYSLLYEEPISRIAVAAMRNLHPEMIEAVQSKALYTTHEEELLGSIKSVCYSRLYI